MCPELCSHRGNASFQHAPRRWQSTPWALRHLLHQIATNHKLLQFQRPKIHPKPKEISYSMLFATATVKSPGSLRAKHPIFSPPVKGAIHWCFCSSEPNLSIGPKYRDFEKGELSQCLLKYKQSSNSQCPSALRHTRTQPRNRPQFSHTSLANASLGSTPVPHTQPETLTLLTLMMTPVDAQPLLISSTAME